MPRPAIKPRAQELLDRFLLTDAADRTRKTYSGGMRRRLDIAASLMNKPPVLFLDEPTTGLDITSRNELWEMIRELVSDGTTVLLTTQYLEEADILANRIAVIDDGRVIANDTPPALKAQLGSTVVEMDMPAGSGERAVRPSWPASSSAERRGTCASRPIAARTRSSRSSGRSTPRPRAAPSPSASPAWTTCSSP